MIRLIVVLYAVPALIAMGASLIVKERFFVTFWGILACIFTVVILHVLSEHARIVGQRVKPILVGGVVCLSLIISIVTLHWPLRAAYWLSRPAMDQLSRDLHAGKEFVGPARVGLFTIHKAEVNRQGIVCLWIETNRGGNTGFVQCGPHRVPFNPWSIISLGDNWQFIHED